MQRIRPGSEAVWLLGLTQILGYGTLYYSVAILAPHIAADVGWELPGILGAFSAGLLASGLASPFAGRIVDRVGAGKAMAIGSAAAALALAAQAASPTGPLLALALVSTQVASQFVQYNAAFSYLAQTEGQGAGRRIVLLTLIAGFASTLFWPLTSALLGTLSWRGVLVAFAAANLFVCAPAHWYLHRAASGPRRGNGPYRFAAKETNAGEGDRAHSILPPQLLRRGLVLTTAGFAISGFMYSAVLAQMVPLLGAIGVGTVAVAVAALFGPSQVLVRVGNLVAGSGSHPIVATVVACALLPASVLLLAAAGSSVAGAVAFVVLFGFGSGLTSIVRGTLPLALFGSDGYGSVLGRITSVQLVAASVAPFALSASIEAFGTIFSLLALAATGIIGLLCFLALFRLGTADGRLMWVRAQPGE